MRFEAGLDRSVLHSHTHALTLPPSLTLTHLFTHSLINIHTHTHTLTLTSQRSFDCARPSVPYQVSHESTVICLRFSPNDSRLVSAGKDRGLSLHENALGSGVGDRGFSTALVVKGAHKRIIWDCAWSGDGSMLLTGSRDGLCKVWGCREAESQEGLELICLLQFSPFAGVAVTSLDILFSKLPSSSTEGEQQGEEEEGEAKHWLCCVGSEAGQVGVLRLKVSSTWGVQSQTPGEGAVQGTAVFSGSSATERGLQCFQSTHASASEEWKAPEKVWHGSAVLKIRWSQRCSGGGEEEESERRGCFSFASAGEDRSIRVFSVPR